MRMLACCRCNCCEGCCCGRLGVYREWWSQLTAIRQQCCMLIKLLHGHEMTVNRMFVMFGPAGVLLVHLHWWPFLATAAALDFIPCSLPAASLWHHIADN
jgi:hypothetical protein